MKIYTKTGDQGQTSLFGSAKVAKHDLRVQAYGDIDELNSILGVAICQIKATKFNDQENFFVADLHMIQNWLFNLGSELATPNLDFQKKLVLIKSENILWLEQQIDSMEKELPALKNFILPGGCSCAAQIHLARTVCRRSERLITKLNETEILRAEVIMFLNRLSDYFFVLARYLNMQMSTPEQTWQQNI